MEQTFSVGCMYVTGFGFKTPKNAIIFHLLQTYCVYLHINVIGVKRYEYTLVDWTLLCSSVWHEILKKTLFFCHGANNRPTHVYLFIRYGSQIGTNNNYSFVMECYLHRDYVSKCYTSLRRCSRAMKTMNVTGVKKYAYIEHFFVPEYDTKFSRQRFFCHGADNRPANMYFFNKHGSRDAFIGEG